MNISKKKEPRWWQKWFRSGAVQECGRGWSTDGPTPPPCNPDIYQNGICLMVTSTIGSNAIERWVKLIAEKSGQPVDWHWFGGRARILALGDLERVKRAIVDLLPEHDRLYREAVGRLGLSQEMCPPHRPDWYTKDQQSFS